MQNIEKHNLKKRFSFVVITLLLFVSSTFKHNKGWSTSGYQSSTVMNRVYTASVKADFP